MHAGMFRIMTGLCRPCAVLAVEAASSTRIAVAHLFNGARPAGHCLPLHPFCAADAYTCSFKCIERFQATTRGATTR